MVSIVMNKNKNHATQVIVFFLRQLLLYPLLLFLVVGTLYAQKTPVNLFIPYDPFIVPIVLSEKQSWQLSFYAESGVRDAHGVNSHGDFVNPLLLWNDSENVVTMLDGAPADSLIAQLRNEIGHVTDIHSGIVVFDGTYKERFAGTVAVKKTVMPYLYLSIYFPFYAYKLSDVSFIDQTGNQNPQDRLIKSKITDHLAETVLQLGDLSISPWERSGTGDVTLQLAWSRKFLQNRPMLKTVQVYVHAGVSLPTARRANPDKLLDFSFGNNGAFAIPFGASLDLTYWSKLRLGLDVLLVHTFAHIEERRIKTAQGQTDLLLLQKAECYVDYGLTQRFYLYTALQDLIPDITLSVGYYFEKQGEDTIYVRHNEFQTAQAQNTQLLDEKTLHQAIAYVQYKKEYADSALLFSLVARVPFNGKRVLVSSTLGASLSLAF
jgi:hypothetical protein